MGIGSEILNAQSPPATSPSPVLSPASSPKHSWQLLLLIVIALYTMTLLFLAGYALIKLWPSSPAVPGNMTSAPVNATLFAQRVSFSQEARLVILVLISGAIGSLSFGLYAEFLHIARNDFDRRWTLWYFARPFVGAFFGLVFYLALRAGLLSTATPLSQLNIFGFMALAALVGMFTEETLAKFKLIAESMLTKANFISEDYYSGETAPADGRYVFVKHVRGSNCTLPHQGLAPDLKKGDTIPTPTPCNQLGIFMRVSP